MESAKCRNLQVNGGLSGGIICIYGIFVVPLHSLLRVQRNTFGKIKLNGEMGEWLKPTVC